MKKYILPLLALALCLTVLGGCMPEPYNGADGKSAYELARDNGFEGSLDEWLASLAGKDGKDGRDGEDGEDGLKQQTTVIIDGETDPLGNLRYAAAVVLRSAVSVVCPNGAGAGVIYKLDKETGEAYVITNHHVVYDKTVAGGIAKSIELYVYGAEYKDYAIPATYLGGSVYYDIAVLHIAASDRLKAAFSTAVTLANGLAVGQTALAVGNPEAGGLSVTSGTVSMLSETVEMTAADGKTKVNYRVLRTDTPVNGGNSGGGLFNGRGELVGIVNAKLIESHVENIGYAIPVGLAVAVTENILATCDGETVTTPQRATLGFTVRSGDHEAVYDPETGLITLKESNTVTEVVAGSAADGKILVGDTVLSVKVDARPTLTPNRQYEVADELLYARVGSQVTFTLLREGEEVTVTLTITENEISSH